MTRDINNTITLLKKYILKNYNYFIIDINNAFIGCKFHNDTYYIFFVSIYEDFVTLTYRLDFTKKDVIRISIDDIDDSALMILIDNTIHTAIEKNNKLDNPRKMLKNSLINYNYNQNTNNIKENNRTTKKAELKAEIEQENLDTPLENVVMSRRLKNGLFRYGCRTLGDFLKMTLNQVKGIRNLGENSVKEASYLLKARNHDLLPIHEPELIEDCSEEISISDDMIDKLYSKTLIDECGFSARLSNCLKQNNIYNLADFIRCPKEKFRYMNNLGEKSFKEAMDYKQHIIMENKFGEDNSDFIIRVIKAISENNELSIIMLKNYLGNNTQYPVDRMIDDINNLRNKGVIEFTMNGIKIKKKKLIDVLNEFDTATKILVTERLNGKTLQELGEIRNITRERVRQKLVKAFEKIPTVDEDKYRELYEEYNFAEEDFVKIFGEEKYIYNYLKEKCKSGEKNIENALTDTRFNEKQKDIIRNLRKIIKLYGETIFLSKQNIINILIKEYAKRSIEIDKFTEIYNDFCNKNPEYKLTVVDSRSMEGIISRSGIAVFDLGRKFRYYNYLDIVGNEELESLKEIYYNIDTGYYSTLVLYKNNPVLMSALDIRNEYELHNISKQYFNNRNGIVFDRMPNFSINGISKDDFFKEKINELSPISISDFSEIMETEYGHKASTISSYLLSTFQDYIDNGILKKDIRILPDSEIERIKYILKKPIYSIEELKMILSENSFENIDEILTSANMYKVGYRIRSSYAIKKEISSIEDYLKKLADKQDFISNDNFLKNSTYYAMKKKVEKSYDIFLISNDEYITIKKLNLLGIKKEDIMNFCNQVKEKFSNNEYFTLSNVRDLVEIEKLDDFGFDDIFLENIIGNIDDIFYTKFSNNKIYSFLYHSFDSKKFVIDTIAGRESIFVDDLQEEFMEKYGITVTQERIKNAIIDTELYFSDELNKIYQNKEYYYEEVFNYE